MNTDIFKKKWEDIKQSLSGPNLDLQQEPLDAASKYSIKLVFKTLYQLYNQKYLLLICFHPKKEKNKILIPILKNLSDACLCLIKSIENAEVTTNDTP